MESDRVVSNGLEVGNGTGANVRAWVRALAENPTSRFGARWYGMVCSWVEVDKECTRLHDVSIEVDRGA
jgi:hypothetical protein